MSGAKSRAPALRSSFANVRGLLPRWAWILVFLGLAIAYPYVVPNLLGGGAGDDLLDASVNTLGYIIMALGLNIVVGFAGLLDLGYVAFYAIGAFVIGFVQSFNEGLTWHAPGGDWTRSIVFGILIAVLVFRPEGILGEQTPEGA